MWVKSKIDFFRGQKAYRKEDFYAAFKYFSRAEKFGEQNAAFMCGIMLINGEAGSVDFNKGIELAKGSKAILVRNSKKILNKALLDYYAEHDAKDKYLSELEIAADEFFDYMALDKLIYLNYCGRLYWYYLYQTPQNKEKACWYYFVQHYFSECPVLGLLSRPIISGSFPITIRKFIVKILYKFSNKKELSDMIEDFIKRMSTHYSSDKNEIKATPVLQDSDEQSIKEELARKIYTMLKGREPSIPSCYVILIAIMPFILQAVLPLGNDMGFYNISVIFNKYFAILSIIVTLFIILSHRSNLFLIMLFLISSGVFNIINVFSIDKICGFNTKTIATVCLSYALAGILKACLSETSLKRSLSSK